MAFRVAADMNDTGADVSLLSQAESGPPPAEEQEVAYAAELAAFAEALAGGDSAELAAARADLDAVAGRAVTADAAAIAANFQCMTRVADATGIPLDTPMMAASQSVRDKLDFHHYASARNSKQIPKPLRPMARLLGKLIPAILKRVRLKL